MNSNSGDDLRGVWVVLPTYCEAENIAVVLDRLTAAMPGTRILVVDDNSPDGTAEIVRGRTDSAQADLLVRRAKTGLGAAYLEGFKYVLERGAEIVVTMDSDLSHDPDAVADLLACLNHGGCVVGSRYIPGGEIVNWPLRRRLLSSAANRFVKTLFDLPVEDCTSGFRVYRRKIVEQILAVGPRSQGYSFQVEALRIAVACGPVTELPITFVERVNGVSKMGFSEIVHGARTLFSLRLRGDRATKK